MKPFSLVLALAVVVCGCGDPGTSDERSGTGGTGGPGGIAGFGGMAGITGAGGTMLCAGVDCDDSNECTGDTCDLMVEQCKHSPVSDGTPCNLGPVPGLCLAGVCEQNRCAGVDCDDGDPCTTDSCDPAAGTCTYVNTCQDLDPPVLTDFDFNPKSVDVTSQSQVVTCSLTLTDSGVGVSGTYCQFNSPSDLHSEVCRASSPSLGDRFDGTWSCNVTIPQNVEGGTWYVAQIFADDELPNRTWLGTSDLEALGFPTQLDVASPGPDIDGPVLTDFDFNPKSVDVTSQSQVVTCSLTLTDSGVGVSGTYCQFNSPSDLHSEVCRASSPSLGDRFDGTWSCNVTIPQNVEGGTWYVAQIFADDELPNRTWLGTSDLEALGFPTQLDVTYGGGPPQP